MTSIKGTAGGLEGIRLALIGCGNMGLRHIRGLERLQRIGLLPFRLTAVCDPIPSRAEQARALTQELLGMDPGVYSTVDQSAGDSDAVDVTVSPAWHEDVAVTALLAGCHVMVEKPMALTVRQATHMNQVAHQHGRILAVAENYRRDPMNRLGKALIDGGAIGSPYLMIQGSSSGGDGVIITPWRHLKSQGGIAADMGVHYADLFEYFLGPVTRVSGMGRVVEATRNDVHGTPHMADAEDLVIGSLRFDNGAMGNLILNLAGRAPGWFYRAVFGTGGTLVLPSDRTGNPVHLWRESLRQSGEISQVDLLEMVPEFTLDPTLALLFGGERLTCYENDWEETDANLIASELHDFAAAIAYGVSPEVSGEQGIRSLALIHGFLEADRTNGEIPMDDLISGAVHAYQDSFAHALHNTAVDERGDGK